MMDMKMVVHTKPRFLFKLGVAVAVAVPLVGYAVSYFRQRNLSPIKNVGNEGSTTSVEGPSVVTSIGYGRGLRDGSMLMQNENALANIVHNISPPLKTKARIGCIKEKLSDSESSSMKEEELLFSDFSHEAHDQEPESGAATKPEHISVDFKKKQDASNKVLEDQLKITMDEAKCSGERIKNLQDENRRLKIQASECSGIMQELKVSRTHIKLLKWRLIAVRCEAREKISSLEKRISLLQEECNVPSQDTDNLERLKELEDESADLRSKNSTLTEEKLELSRRFESAQVFTENLQKCQVKVLEELELLKEEKKRLEKRIGKLQADHTEIEELGHLKCLDGFLRSGLKDPEQSSGKIVDKNLSLVEKLNYAEMLSNEKEPIFSSVKLMYSDSTKRKNVDYNKSHSNRPIRKPGEVGRGKFLGRLKKLVGKDGQTSKASCAYTSKAHRRKSVSTYSMGGTSSKPSSKSICCCFTTDNLLEGREPDAEETWKTKSVWHQISFTPPQSYFKNKEAQ